MTTYIKSQHGSAISSSQASPDGTAVLVVADNQHRLGLILRNDDDTNSVYIGGAAVTTSNGHILGPGEVLNLDHTWRGELYGVTAGATVLVTALEVTQ